jgi:rod shape determining protein RodA
MNRKGLNFDAITLGLYLLMVLLGWMTIYANTSVGGHGSPFDLSAPHGRQLMWIGLAILIGSIILLFDYRFIEAVGYFAYGGALLLLIITLFLGREINGAKAWLFIAGQPLQPGELAKVATAMALAQYMSRIQFSIRNLQELLTASLIVLAPAAIVVLQNDMGSALVFFSFLLVFYREGLSHLVPLFLIVLVAVVVLTLGLKAPLLVSGVVLGLGILSFLYFFQRRYWTRILAAHALVCGFFIAISFSADFLVERLKPHQQTRIMVLFDPSLDPQGSGYNVIQSKIAIGSGGLSGKGYLAGNYTKYKFVPKQETDFIYCTVGEEYGWMGSSLIIVVFFLLIWRIQYLAENSKTRYSRIFGYGVLSILACHTLINIGMTIGLAPVIGIPLPFFSYGGSALISFSVLIFLMANLYSHRMAILGSKV